ncbi:MULTISPECIES: ABC transporter ATP-binding protein [unclassified Caulobacter]|uniref:ABC transporter ATP-binding protein n=1 Tax=unclassified Caulobacter TaxID=2648921 RepID=UPI0006F1EB25|nr:MULTISPECIES: ABC transporter ATP-binding protein [unclassified Caulobacter]KQV56893.1 sulfonate ABC transporter ATP-binding protein [Caulobacter sp. Root342]KQV72532.1 sulfonate ABC transporter ATP-binding protein [Caulobacter sp. Root343]
MAAPQPRLHRPEIARSAPKTPEPAVRLSKFVRRFGDNTVIDGLDLSIAPGEFVALLGASGSGKTTLLRTLAGLDSPDDQDVKTPDARAVVFQDARLLPWKTVWRNVALGLSGGPRGGSVRARAEAALKEVGLGHRLDAWPGTLSGGEAQRTALARALVREPGLLLLDEPFAALDALTRLKMHDLVLSLWREHSPAVLLVTHDVDEAIALADRVLVLDKGRIAAEERITLDRPRAPDARFQAIRRRLLSQLGVECGPVHGEGHLVAFPTGEVVL